MNLQGQCHCGALRVGLRLSRPPSQTAVRACQCSFCRAHGARSVADPGGAVTIRAAAPGDLVRYRFDKATADFLICAHCGVYAAAVLNESEAAWAVLNVRGLGLAEFSDMHAEPVDYSGESTTERIARRKARWTPATIVFDTSQAA